MNWGYQYKLESCEIKLHCDLFRILLQSLLRKIRQTQTSNIGKESRTNEIGIPSSEKASSDTKTNSSIRVQSVLNLLFDI